MPLDIDGRGLPWVHSCNTPWQYTNLTNSGYHLNSVFEMTRARFNTNMHSVRAYTKHFVL